MRLFFFVTILFIVGCNNQQEANIGTAQLQNTFGTANWQVIKATDTSYIFFSPQTNGNFQTYEYTLFKGDSANTQIGSIIKNAGRVEWNFFNKTLVLDNIKDTIINWKDSTNTNYILTKQNDSVMLMKTPNDDLQFKKTLPLSTFLVRAKYDYEHGSKLIDSSEIKPRSLIHY